MPPPWSTQTWRPRKASSASGVFGLAQYASQLCRRQVVVVEVDADDRPAFAAMHRRAAPIVGAVVDVVEVDAFVDAVAVGARRVRHQLVALRQAAAGDRVGEAREVVAAVGGPAAPWRWEGVGEPSSRVVAGVRPSAMTTRRRRPRTLSLPALQATRASDAASEASESSPPGAGAASRVRGGRSQDTGLASSWRANCQLAQRAARRRGPAARACRRGARACRRRSDAAAPARSACRRRRGSWAGRGRAGSSRRRCL